jgi:hypothetical protein
LTLSLAIVCEAEADRALACGLADRVLVAEVDWIEPDSLDAYRHWRGHTPTEPFLRRQSVSDLAKERGIRILARDFGEEEELLNARETRKALLLLITADHPPNAIAVVWDSDGEPERRHGMEQARRLTRVPGIPIILGLAHTKRECWILAGFIPKNESEQARLDALRSELGFNPCARAEELTAKHSSEDKRNAKRVHADLLEDDREREEACWRNTPLDTLHQQGANTGLADYLMEIREHLVPLFKPTHP